MPKNFITKVFRSFISWPKSPCSLIRIKYAPISSLNKSNTTHMHTSWFTGHQLSTRSTSFCIWKHSQLEFIGKLKRQFDDFSMTVAKFVQQTSFFNWFIYCQITFTRFDWPSGSSCLQETLWRRTRREGKANPLFRRDWYLNWRGIHAVINNIRQSNVITLLSLDWWQICSQNKFIEGHSLVLFTKSGQLWKRRRTNTKPVMSTDRHCVAKKNSQ